MSEKCKGTIAIDFDGVIHDYKEGWKDGSIYGEIVPEAISFIQNCLRRGFSVCIFSTRNPRQIKNYLLDKFDREGMGSGFYVKVIPFWKKFWNDTSCVGVTRRKLPALVYIDDRGYRHESWLETNKEFENIFKGDKCE